MQIHSIQIKTNTNSPNTDTLHALAPCIKTNINSPNPNTSIASQELHKSKCIFVCLIRFIHRIEHACENRRAQKSERNQMSKALNSPL